MSEETAAVRVGVRVHFKLPGLPNFLRLEESDAAIDIRHLDEATLRSIGAAWTEALVAHAKRRAPFTEQPPSTKPRRKR